MTKATNMIALTLAVGFVLTTTIQTAFAITPGMELSGSDTEATPATNEHDYTAASLLLLANATNLVNGYRFF